MLDDGSPAIDPAVFELGVPVLDVCYGMQLMARLLGGCAERGRQREYGRTCVHMDTTADGLLIYMNPVSVCWMSHTWQVARPPECFEVIAHTDNCPVDAMADTGRRLYGVQFHPEAAYTE